MGRFLWLMGEILLASARYPFRRVHYPALAPLPTRARWLQHACRRVLRILSVEIHVEGPIPQSGFLISNHLSYLDILVLSSITPAVFVAKREVRYWPVFGWFASMAGTLFVHREKKTDVARLNREIARTADAGVLLVVFPEGTSSDGRTVLPFKSPLLEPAARGAMPVAAACILYCLDDGSVADDVCYWRDMTLISHLVNLLSKQSVGATVRFAAFDHRGLDRKELARGLRSTVLGLQSLSPSSSEGTAP